ncbi:plasmid fertility inhibition factor family protein [Allomesorhizobium alhagi]|uniref:Uncharacterized protein n=1 Tax=Mesorhizobium alhagi CCNWXJ12-2 TaxID=1107882 RepID=H0HWY7_9HYPH|nr:hypothetical protein [Mesorhizobium alhagi]EHK54748.1 hypothetical protein MAXJ12_23522 [Mesorhizobium alhagi CCNWXJ12-2]
MPENNEIYVIRCPELNNQVAHFQKDRLCDWPIVWVDLPRLIQVWEQSPRALLLPQARTWEVRKYQIYREGLESTIIPFTTINVQTYGTQIGRLTVPRISYGWDNHDQAITVGFVNGRHRTRMLEDVGVRTIPVQIHEREAEELRRTCAPSPGIELETFFE